MNKFMILSVLVAIAAAAPSSPETKAALRRLPALLHEEIHDEFGQYVFRYVTAEGTIVTERGRLVPSPAGNGYVLVTEGEVEYKSDDGKTIITKYSAGLDGLKIEGDHLPVAPEPIPVLEPVTPTPVPEPVTSTPAPETTVAAAA